MSVCWSSNTDLYKKSDFPYVMAAKLSTHLWSEITDYNVSSDLVIPVYK